MFRQYFAVVNRLNKKSCVLCVCVRANGGQEKDKGISSCRTLRFFVIIEEMKKRNLWQESGSS